MQNRFGLLNTDVMPIFMIIALDIIITMRFSINCSAVIHSPIVIFAISREATSETYAPRVYLPSYKFSINYFAIFTFQSINQKTQKYFTLRFSISIRSHFCKWPWRDWQPLYRIGCKLFDCLCRCSWLVRCLPLDWYLGSQTEGNTYLYFAASPFTLEGKNQCKLKK